MGRKSTADLDDEVRKVKGLEVHGKALRINFTYRAVRCRETLQLPLTARNIRYAADLLSTIRHQIKTRAFNYSDHFPDSPNAKKFGHSSTNRTITQVTDEWFTSRIELTEPVRRRYDSPVKFIKQTIGKILVNNLLKKEVDTYRMNLIQDRAASTANYHIAIFQQILRYAYENKYAETDKSEWASKFKLNQTIPDPFTVEEVDQLVNDGCTNQSDKNWVTLSVWTGLRTGELCALAWEDVDLDNNRMLIRRNVTERMEFKETKTNTERTVVLLPPARAAMESQFGLTGELPKREVKINAAEMKRTSRMKLRFVFSPTVNARRPAPLPVYLVHTRMKAWNNIVVRAGVRRRTQYQTRHTFACWALTFHGNPVFVANQMGHKDFTQIVKTYGKWMPEESDYEAEKIWDFYSRKFPNSAPKVLGK